jgi:hypothetical protein
LFVCVFTSAQPERLPQLQTSAQEPGKEETGKIKNGGHTRMSNGNGIPHGAKHVSVENHKISAPVSQKMHRKIQSSLSVNNDISKKSKVNAVFSPKAASSPEGEWDIDVHLKKEKTPHMKLLSHSKSIKKTPLNFLQ